MKRVRWMWGGALLAACLVVGLALREPEAQRPVPVAEQPRRVRPVLPQVPVAAPVPRGPGGVVPAAAPAPAPGPAADPVHTALSAGKKDTAVVIEVGALLHLPAGRLALDCLLHAFPEENPLQRFRDLAHVDVLRDLDRMAFTEKGLVLSGRFAGARWDRLLPNEVEASPYGTRSTYFEPKERVDAQGRPRRDGYASATLGDTLFVMSPSGRHTKHVVDVIEGREPAPAPLFTSAQMDGEIYALLSASGVENLIPWGWGQDHLKNVALEVIDQVEVHVDASRDVRITADLRLLDAARTDEVAAFVEAGLVFSRQQVQKADNPLMAAVLGQLRLVRDGGQLRLEADLPLAALERDLAACREQAVGHARDSVR